MSSLISFPVLDIKSDFLRKLNNKQLENFGEYALFVYQNHLGDLTSLIDFFRLESYIRDATLTESINKSMLVSQLKGLLKTKGTKVSGTKPVLIDRLIEVLTLEEIELINEKGQCLIVTQKGWEYVNSETDRFEGELNEFKQNVIKEFTEGNHLCACKYISDFYASYPFPMGMGVDYKFGFNEKFISIVECILNTDYITNSMEIDFLFNKKVRSVIATYYLFRFSSFHKSDDLSKNILEIYPNFECKEIEDYLISQQDDDFNELISQKEVIDYFSKAIIKEAEGQIEFDIIISMKNYYNGISVLEGRICQDCIGKEQFFYWSDIEKLPKLPKSPDCTCIYLPILD